MNLICTTDWTTALVAWWGAVLATIVLLWDIYKHYSNGPCVKMKVMADRAVLGEPELEDKTLIIVEATNIGDRPTTLKSMPTVFYETWWQRLWRKPAKQFLIANPGRGRPFPHKLEVGETWNGFAEQSEDVTRMARDGYLYCHLYLSSQVRPVKRRVVLESKRTEKP